MQTPPASSQSRWFIPYRSHPAPRLRLFCLPHAGGSPSAYYPWREQLPPGVDLLAAQLPGRGARLSEPCSTSIADIADRLATALQPYQDGIPYALFCHSMGALVGFELMRCMRRDGRPLPAIAFLSGYRAPARPGRRPRIHDQPDQALIEHMKRLGGTPPEILDHPELMEIALPILRADYTALETYRYRPEPPLPVPLVVLRGTEDPDVDAADLDAWREHTSARFEAAAFPGGHFYLDAQRAQVLALLRARL